jgi:Icc protein
VPFILDRRRFLHSLMVAGIAGSARMSAANSETRVALLSDTHIAADPQDTFRGFYPHRNLEKVCGQLDQNRFDMLVINGDLARQTGEAADYAALRSFVNPLAEKMPVIFGLGNHDDRKNARAQMSERTGDVQPVEKKFVSTVDAGPVQFVLLDSLMVTNIAAGQLGKKQRDWLSNYLGEHQAKPTVVFVHHDPDPDDDNGLVDANLLLPVLTSHRHVKALIFGHTHVYQLTSTDGLHLINLPAVGYNFADGNPVGWVNSTFTASGARLELHAVAGETKNDGKVSELTWR